MVKTNKGLVMANKIIVIRTLKQLDYLLTKFENNIEVYTKEDSGFSTPKTISRYSKNCRYYYAMEDKDNRKVDEEIVLEELENILNSKKYVAIENETNIILSLNNKEKEIKISAEITADNIEEKNNKEINIDNILLELVDVEVKSIGIYDSDKFVEDK